MVLVGCRLGYFIQRGSLHTCRVGFRDMFGGGKYSEFDTVAFLGVGWAGAGEGGGR